MQIDDPLAGRAKDGIETGPYTVRWNSRADGLQRPPGGGHQLGPAEESHDMLRATGFQSGAVQGLDFTPGGSRSVGSDRQGLGDESGRRAKPGPWYLHQRVITSQDELSQRKSG